MLTPELIKVLNSPVDCVASMKAREGKTSTTIADVTLTDGKTAEVNRRDLVSLHRMLTGQRRQLDVQISRVEALLGEFTKAQACAPPDEKEKAATQAK